MSFSTFLENREVKVISLFFLVWLFLMCFLGIKVIDMEVEKLNRNYINGNLVLAKRIIEVDEDLKDEVIGAFSKEADKEEIEESRDILTSYGYDEKMDGKYNIYLDGLDGKFKSDYFLSMFIGVSICFVFVLWCFKNVFKRVSKITKVAEMVALGNYKVKLDYINDEGYISKLAYQIEAMTNRMKSIIEELNMERINLKNLISDISHQLRTPLSTLVMNNSIIECEECNDINEIKDITKVSSIQLDKMEWLIESLLKMARFDAGVIKFKKVEAIIGKTIDSALISLFDKAESKNIAIEIKGDYNAVINHDKRWLSEGLSNIVKNAIEYTSVGGKIVIEVISSSLINEIKISDNGIGIKEQDLNKVFSRYYKGDDSTNPRSIGIGLALSRKIIEGHGGSISVESHVGLGTTFSIIFLKEFIVK